MKTHIFPAIMILCCCSTTAIAIPLSPFLKSLDNFVNKLSVKGIKPVSTTSVVKPVKNTDTTAIEVINDLEASDRIPEYLVTAALYDLYRLANPKATLGGRISSPTKYGISKRDIDLTRKLVFLFRPDGLVQSEFRTLYDTAWRIYDRRFLVGPDVGRVSYRNTLKKVFSSDLEQFGNAIENYGTPIYVLERSDASFGNLGTLSPFEKACLRVAVREDIRRAIMQSSISPHYNPRPYFIHTENFLNGKIQGGLEDTVWRAVRDELGRVAQAVLKTSKLLVTHVTITKNQFGGGYEAELIGPEICGASVKITMKLKKTHYKAIDVAGKYTIVEPEIHSMVIGEDWFPLLW